MEVSNFLLDSPSEVKVAIQPQVHPQLVVAKREPVDLRNPTELTPVTQGMDFPTTDLGPQAAQIQGLLFDMLQRFGTRTQQIYKARQRRVEEHDKGSFRAPFQNMIQQQWKAANHLDIFGYTDASFGYTAMNLQNDLQHGLRRNVVVKCFDDFGMDLFFEQKLSHTQLRKDIAEAFQGRQPRTSLSLRLPNWESHPTLVRGREIMSPLFDFAMHFHYNFRSLINHQGCVLFELSGLQSAEEAKLWDDMCTFMEDRYGVNRGSIRTTVVLDGESTDLSFQLEDSIYMLRDHFGRLKLADNSFFLKLLNHKPRLLNQNPPTLPLQVPFADSADKMLQDFAIRLDTLCRAHNVHVQTAEIQDFGIRSGLPLAPVFTAPCDNSELNLHLAPALEAPQPKRMRPARSSIADVDQIEAMDSECDKVTHIIYAHKFVEMYRARDLHQPIQGFFVKLLQLPMKPLDFAVNPQPVPPSARAQQREEKKREDVFAVEVVTGPHQHPQDWQRLQFEFGVKLDVKGFHFSNELDTVFQYLNRKQFSRQIAKREKGVVTRMGPDFSPGQATAEIIIKTKPGSRHPVASQIGLALPGALYIISGPPMYVDPMTDAPVIYCQHIQKSQGHPEYQVKPVVYKYTLTPAGDHTHEAM